MDRTSFTAPRSFFNRSSHFAANTFFNNFSSVPRPFLNRNQYGGKIGGPILKNKLFFFFGTYEGFRLRQSTSVNRTILLPNARNGIFTFRDTTGATRTVNLLAGGFATVTRCHGHRSGNHQSHSDCAADGRK